jgi:hypothetical protein
MRRLIGYARTIIDAGIASGELSPELDVEAEAAMIVATFEGAVMLSRLYGDPRYVRLAATRLARQAALMAHSSAR